MAEKEHGAGGARRKAILATAREMFLDQGYKPVSMSAIAARLGGSKTTLWSYFRSKPVLFMAVAEDLVDEYAEFISASLVLNQPLDRSLTVFGERLLAALTSPPITALMRIVTGEARDIPGLGQMFHEQGLARGWRITAEYFAELQRRGLLRSDADPFRAAQHSNDRGRCGRGGQGLLRGLWSAASLTRPPPELLFETHLARKGRMMPSTRQNAARSRTKGPQADPKAPLGKAGGSPYPGSKT